MKIITIMEYSDRMGKNYVDMTKIWLHRLSKYAPDFEVELLYVHKKNNALFTESYQKFLENFPNVHTKKIERMGYKYKHKGSGSPSNFDYKYSTWLQDPPFILMDTDIFLFNNLKEFYKEAKGNPFVGLGHGSYHRKQERALNGGFFYLEESGFLNPDVAKEDFKNLYPSQADQYIMDQNALAAHLKAKKYDPFLVEEGERWNWYGRESDPLVDGAIEQAVDEKGRPLCAVHFFGGMKPWRCSQWKSFFEKSVREVEKMSE